MATMIRACSYTCEIMMPVPASDYSKILVTFSQNGKILVEKNKEDLEATEDGVLVQLSQDDTRLFSTEDYAVMQLRAYRSTYDAPGSEIWPIQVYPALNDEVLS